MDEAEDAVGAGLAVVVAGGAGGVADEPSTAVAVISASLGEAPCFTYRSIPSVTYFSTPQDVA